MSEHMRIPFPANGVHVDGTHGDQPPGTTPDASNVRVIDPVSGRSVGAQRSGLSKLFADPIVTGERVTTMAQVSRSRPSLAHTQLTEIPNAVSTPEEIEPEWAKRTPRGGPARAIALDSQGNILSIDGPSQLIKHNSDGKLVTQISLPANAGFTVASRIVIGPDDAAYVGASNADGTVGFMWRYVPDESVEDIERLKLAWTVTFDKGVRDFAVDGDVLVVVLEGEDNPKCELAAAVALAATQPIGVWRRPCPDPINDIGIAKDGGILLAVGQNAARGAGLPAPNKLSRVTLPWPYGPMWSPHDLDEARERLYGWWDAKTIAEQTAVEDEGEVFAWPSRVNWDTSAGGGLGNYGSVYDTTARTFRIENTTPGVADFRHGPTYRERGAGGVPCLDFNADRASVNGGSQPTGEALFTGNNTSVTAKTAVTGKLPDQRSLFPGWEDANYCLGMAIRVRRRSEIGVLLSHLGGPASTTSTSYGLCVNGAKDASATLINTHVIAEGGVLFDIGARQHSPNDYVAANDFLNTRVTNGSHPSSAARVADGDTDDDTFAAIITLNILDPGTGTGFTSELRVNGELLDKFSISETRSASGGTGGPSVSTCYAILGCATALGNLITSAGSTNTNVYSVTPTYRSFDGEVLEMIVVLGSTTTTPHDTAVTSPTWFAEGDTFGSIPSILARKEPTIATEVELLEGYLAHANGLAHLLPNAAPPFQNGAGGASNANHPFGGTGEFPVSPELPTSAEAEQDLWTNDLLLAKINAATGGAEWVLRGGGVGAAQSADEDDGIFAAGPAMRSTGINDVSWSTRLNESQTYLRRIVDFGYTYDVRAKSIGILHFFSQGGIGPVVTIDPGVGGPVVFTAFNPGGSSGSPGFDLGGGPNPLNATVFNLATAINGSGGNMSAFLVGNSTLVILGSDVGSVGNIAMSSPLAATTLYIDGLRDGRDGTNCWTLTGAAGVRPTEEGCRLLADQDGDVYTVLQNTDNPSHVTKRSETNGATLWTYAFAGTRLPYSLAAPRRFFDWNPDTVRGPEFLYVGHSDGGVTASATLTKLRLVAEEVDETLPGTRIVTSLAVVDGGIYTFSSAGAALATNGAGVLDPGASFISHASLFGEVFFTDGRAVQVYRAKTNDVELLEPETGGEVPRGARLLCAWNGRLVAARTRDDAHGWHMSAKDDPYDWNLFPAVVTSKQAVSGAGGPAGASPDIVNALIPYSSDYLIIGGDSTIRQLSGDPAFGGQIDLLTDSTGIAFGRAWCKDPQGRLFFFGSRGGVYVMVPGQQPMRLTLGRIERRLQDIDLAANYVELVWNHRDEGLHVLVFSVAGGAVNEHWFYDAKNNAWFPDTFGTSQPSACLTSDGDDPDDRVLLLGHEDGRVRVWDGAATSDDGSRIYSRVKLGPLGPAETPHELLWSRLTVTLDPDQGGALAEFRVGDTAARGGELVGEEKLGPGRNYASPLRASGGYVWLTIANAGVSERWAFEAATVQADSAGLRRVRR